ncbi:MAG: exonuclease domain-containing protein [Hyphomicrobiaceae bacterium]
MRPNIVVPGLIAAVALLCFALGGYAAAYGARHEIGVGAALSLSFLGVATAIAVAAVLIHLKVSRPIEMLAREMRTHAQVAPQRALEVPQGHVIAPLPEAAEGMLVALRAARGIGRDELASATRRSEEHKSRLEAILLDLSEGVIVCNLQHRILLYNQSAARVLESPEGLGLDRSLFGLMAREPIQHILEQLMSATEPPFSTDVEGGSTIDDHVERASRKFVCATVEQGTLLQVRISLVRDAVGTATGYVLTFADVGAELENLALRDSLLREVVVEWRRPLANLRAAAEMLVENPDLEAGDRHIFEDIIGKEVETIGTQFAEVNRRYDRLASGPWPMADLYSLDLLRTISNHLSASDDIAITPIGVPVWLHADGHSLMLALEHLLRAVSGKTGLKAFDVEARFSGNYAYVEIIWDGAALPLAVIGTWLQEPLKGTVANRTVVQIVERHGGELWSQVLPNGRACLRFPLKRIGRPVARKAQARVAPRPEFYDLELFNVRDAAHDDLPLRKMSFVVFDTETTGLRPLEGDELLSIGGVRVINGRILTGETFERLINPRRDIPKISTRIHGITEEAVASMPPVEVVLPQFKSFVGDSVLVAYNAAFDMKFIEIKEAATGVKFDNPVLDAQLLSVFAQPDIAEHSLNAIAQQLGIEVIARHTAIGDAMTTAAVFVKLLDLLSARGVETFGQAIQISTRMMEQRRKLLHA